MPQSKSLRRLLRVRQLVEEQRRAELEESIGALRRLQRAQESVTERRLRGGQLIDQSARQGQELDRIVGLAETSLATAQGASLDAMIQDAEQESALQRELYLEKRVERRQAEALLDERWRLETQQNERREQQSLDDWRELRRAVARAQKKAASHAGGRDPKAPS